MDPAVHKFARLSLMRHQARQKQVESQFGLGRPPISLEFNGYRLVAVGPELHWSKAWKTFPDFLMDYFKKVMGSEWGEAQLKKPWDQRHILFMWYAMVCEYQKTVIMTQGQPTESAMTGAVCGVLWLTYGLYLLRHNAEIQLRLLQRLRAADPVNIFGALQEVIIAAAMIRAGFELELENEADGSETHCEFTATSKFTGNKFSVEVKVCNPGTSGKNDGRPRTFRQLSNALSKAAKHPRIVCIELNRPASGDGGPQVAEQLIKREMRRIRENENNLRINGQPSPPAYVVLSNFPFRYDLQGSGYMRAALLEGLKIPGLNGEAVAFRSPRALSEFRASHVDPFRFVQTLVTMQIPSTLDGELPAKAFGDTDTASQLLVGERYLVKDADGRDVAGELVQARVLEGERNVFGLFRLADGSSVSCQIPISDAELKVYRESPDTFFGVYEPKAQPKDPGEWYEWFLSTYQKTPREGLLRFLADQADIETLRDCPQHELAKIYADRLACSVIAMQRPVVPQRLPEPAGPKKRY
jgi:hypothetical protein